MKNGCAADGISRVNILSSQPAHNNTTGQRILVYYVRNKNSAAYVLWSWQWDRVIWPTKIMHGSGERKLNTARSPLSCLYDEKVRNLGGRMGLLLLSKHPGLKITATLTALEYGISASVHTLASHFQVCGKQYLSLHIAAIPVRPQVTWETGRF